MWRLVFGKYKEIVAAVALFVALDAGVLLLNFYTSYQISDDAHAIQLASRQAMLGQRIFTSIYQVRDDLQNSQALGEDATKLATAFKQFDEVLDAFIYGGSLIGKGQGQDALLVQSDYQQLGQHHLREAEALWKPFRPLISPLVYVGYSEQVEAETLLEKANLAIDYIRQHGDLLLASVNDFAVVLENHTQKKAQRLRYIQAVGISLAIVNFFLILFHFLRKLSFSDNVAARARAETTEILRTVDDGLFLLDADCKIGSEYSASMTRLFKRECFSGVDIVALLKPLVTEKNLRVAKDYIDVLFNERVKSSLVEDLNPLREVEITLTDGSGFSGHVFCFSFSRVYENKKLLHLLVTVRDVTEQVNLRKQLEASHKKANQDIELMLSVIHVDSQLLSDFMQSIEKTVKDINVILEEPHFSAAHYTKKLTKIARLSHGLKGESSALGLLVVEDRLHRLESSVAELQAKVDLEGNDFLRIAVELNELIRVSGSIQSMVSTYSKVNQSLLVDHQDKQVSTWFSLLNNLLQKICNEYGKKARLDLTAFDPALIAGDMHEVVKNALIQFVRNAAVHGLEDGKERRSHGKSQIGTIYVSTLTRDGGVYLEVKDDGRGINFEAIREKLIKTGGYSQAQAEQMTQKELIRFLFKPGFSTAVGVSHHAGRGVGLDLVKSSLDSIGSTLSVRSKPKQFTEFRVRLAAEAILRRA